MSELAVSNTFNNGDVISATKFNTNYSDIVTYINNRNGGTSSWDVMQTVSATGVPLTVNNSSGTNDIVSFLDNGSEVFSISDGGYVNAASNSNSSMKNFNRQVASTGSLDKIDFFTIRFNTQNEASTTTDKIVINKSGIYSVIGLVTVTGTSTLTSARSAIYKNGALFSQNKVFNYYAFAGNDSHFSMTQDIIQCSAGDYIELYAEGVFTGANSGFDFNYLTVSKLS